MHQFKRRPPRLHPGDRWDDLTILAYNGYHENERYANRKRAHHYRVRCTCGHEFVEPQSRLYGKNRMRRCGKCGEQERIEHIRDFANGEKRQPSTPSQTHPAKAPIPMIHWPVPGNV